MNVLGVVVFAATYLLISARRLQLVGLDRPAGALVGAVAFVALGLLTPEAAIAAVDARTLLLLLGVMGMGAFLSVDGFFEHAERQLLRFAGTRTRLLGALVWGAGGLSALLTNDAVCVLGAPLVVGMIRRLGLPPLPFLLALATGANTGSVATLVGNPQNMLCGLLGGLEYGPFVSTMLPVALLGLMTNHAILWLAFRHTLAGEKLEAPPPAPATRQLKITTAVLVLTCGLYLAGTDLAWTSVGGFAALMVLHRRGTGQLWSRIDWSLLVFFGALFVVVAGLGATGAPARFFEAVPLASVGEGWRGWTALSAIFLVGSNLVSNVPFILVVRDQMATLPDPRLGWELLAMASTFAGNLTLLGSVANIIVAEAGRDVGGIGFRQQLRVGAPIALVTTAIGTAWLLVVHG